MENDFLNPVGTIFNVYQQYINRNDKVGKHEARKRNTEIIYANSLVAFDGDYCYYNHIV